MANAVIDFFRGLLNNDILTVFIISMLPIVELRGAIPVAIEMGLSWYEAFGYAFIGSIIVAPILLLILMPILNAMKKIKVFRGLANAVEGLFQSKAESVRKKANKADSRNTEDLIKMIGVFLFVAIPLPLTGVWTGTAVAVFLGLGFWKSLGSVALGNISAGLIMTGLSLLFKENLDLFLTIFMALVLGVLVINIIYLVIKNHLKKKKDENAAQNSENAQVELTNEDNQDKEIESVNEDKQDKEQENTAPQEGVKENLDGKDIEQKSEPLKSQEVKAVSIKNESVTNNNVISGNNKEVNDKQGENTQNKRIDVSNIKTD